MEQIAASMRQWGWTNPILIEPAGEIIAGHARLEAAKLLGWTEAPVMVAVGIYALPPAAIYYAAKRYMVPGLTSGAFKS